VWSTTSGGSGGASVPTSSDNVFFDQSGTYTVTVDAYPATCANLNVTASNYTFAQGAGFVRAYGNVFFASNTTFNPNAFQMVGNTGTYTLTTNGTILKNVYFGISSGGIYSMQDALSCNSILSLYGPLNTNGYNLTAVSISPSGTGRIINMSTSQITLSGGGNSALRILGLTWSPGANITFTSNTGNSLFLLGLSYPPVTFTGAGTVTINNSNTFANFSCTYVGAKTFRFTAGTTNTFVAFNLRGTAGNLYTITSTTTSVATLNKAGTWYMGANSTDSGNNTNLTFSGGSGIDYLDVSYITGSSVPVQGNFLELF
jgi:hypothetical protein